MRSPTCPSSLSRQLLSHLRCGDPVSVLRLFQRMRPLSVPMDSYAFPPLLSSCSLLRLPSLSLQLHSLLLKSLPPPNSFPVPFTSLLNLYSDLSRPSDALTLFDEMPLKDPVSWNSAISCLIRHSRPADALLLFRSMVLLRRLPFTDFTLSAALKACAAARALRPAKQLHARIIISASPTDDDFQSPVTATSLVDLYSACGLARDAVRVFDALECRAKKDAAICNALLAGLVSNRKYEDAFSLLRKMTPPPPNGGVVPLTSALCACSGSSNLAYGREIHCAAVRNGFDRDTMLCNAVLHMYAKCGEVAAARTVFDRICEKNVVSWTAVIDAYGSQGLGAEALKLFQKMMMEEEEGVGVLPNNVTFLSVLSACGHSGLVEDGGKCFFSMKEKYGIDPGPEHYACYIDMLGRAGRTEEAWEVFCSVGRLTSAVCVAMLNACKVGGNFGRGEVVARHLLELDPENPGIYVLVSNFYADAGRWEGVEDLRKAMRGQGLRKEVASSLIAAV